MKLFIRTITIAVLWFGVCRLQASEQSRLASISGLVSDTNGTLIPGVTITVTNTDSQSVITTRTADVPAGKFTVSNLQPGNYEISISLLGFKSTHTIKTLTTGESAQLNVTMKGGFDENPIGTKSQFVVPGVESKDNPPHPENCDVISVDYVMGDGIVEDKSLRRDEPVGYRVTLNRNGNAELHRNGFSMLPAVPDSGFDFLGHIVAEDFTRICQLTKSPMFEDLNSRYGPPPKVISTSPSQLTVTITAGNATKTISASDTQFAPRVLREFEQAIRGWILRNGW